MCVHECVINKKRHPFQDFCYLINDIGPLYTCRLAIIFIMWDYSLLLMCRWRGHLWSILSRDLLTIVDHHLSEMILQRIILKCFNLSRSSKELKFLRLKLFRASNEDLTACISHVSYSRVMWGNHSGSSLIKRMQFKCKDSHQMPFIRAIDRRLNVDPTVIPKSLYKLTCPLTM